MGWEQQEGGDIRSRLTSIVQEFSAFYDNLSTSPQVQVEKALEHLAAEIRNGRTDATSVVTLGTSDCYDTSEDFGWAQVVRDLEDLGISETIATENRTFIVEWIIRAINLGWLDEKIPITEMSSTPTQSSSSPVDLPPQSNNIPNPNLQHLSSMPVWTPRIPVHDMLSNKDLRVDDSLVDDGPPSPIEPEEPETNIVWTAQKIVKHWNEKDWSVARKFLEEQVKAVERGQTIFMNGRNVAPDVRILKHLIGISYSYQGDFINAKQYFESVAQGIYVSGLPLDDGDIAAAHWLGETCIHLVQPVNASLAWAIAFCGLLSKFGSKKLPTRTLKELQHLNLLTGGLNILENSFIQGNRDSSTIFTRMASSDKYNVVLSTKQQIKNLAYTIDSVTYYGKAPSNNISIAEGFLIQPLVSQASWPIPQDPFFRSQSAISLLSLLCKRKSPFPYNQVQIVGGLGSSKSLIFTTKQSVEWLVNTVTLALNIYATDWKINGSSILCRLSHTHNRIAYYECYAIEFRKLPFRNIYGIKISGILYKTRGFVESPMYMHSEGEEQFFESKEETGRQLVIKQQLGDLLRGFLMEAEKAKLAGRKFPSDTPLPPKAPYELGGQSKPMGTELQAVPIMELPVTQLASRELTATEVVELPAEPYR
jgi:hypothetical protein